MTKRSINRPLYLPGLLLPAMVLALGCSDQSASTGPAAVTAESKFLLAAEPAAARDVAEVRKSAQNDDEIVVVGRIGGDANPWVEGIAAFLITDTSLVPCNERPGDDCAVPWDYCCDLDVLKDSRVMVKFVDAAGQPVTTDAQELLGLKELQTVVVRGRAQRDESGNVTVLADGFFVRP